MLKAAQFGYKFSFILYWVTWTRFLISLWFNPLTSKMRIVIVILELLNENIQRNVWQLVGPKIICGVHEYHLGMTC